MTTSTTEHDDERVILVSNRGPVTFHTDDSGQQVLAIVDRREAVAAAIKLARPGDLVLLAGKGHETYQILQDRTIDFDDRETARQILRSLGYEKHAV